MENTNQNDVNATESIGVTEMPKLKNGFTALENLRLCMSEGTAVATTFERAIEHEGLTMEVIGLIKAYYTDDEYPETTVEMIENQQQTKLEVDN